MAAAKKTAARGKTAKGKMHDARKAIVENATDTKYGGQDPFEFKCPTCRASTGEERKEA